ncbi:MULTISPECIES: glycosyltransferase family 4 protein [unclassified Uliginosibacterium]|uniref:glycosyltransferase family 4 protein n=1 Tax=unclassified Uliginosibacterium TaxID=2621521 RepID=UPI000C7B4973|nr:MULTISPECIES: glycosyltransferase family 4 protein [unclassified Uliginosibacterium]MDO6387158.1 glycosyltransferase family 4 protein [Uliginosibacterium sp. 31-12]PLK50821.1 glycosyltransferase family 1 protein [Uliginosibacterium sp. TH139]
MKESHDAAAPLHLALVRQAYNPYGGAERFIERALKALGEDAVQITLITRNWGGEHKPGVKVKLLGAPRLGRLLRDITFTRSVRSLIKTQVFDLVQSHERIPGCDIFRAGDGVHASWLEQRARTLGPLGRLAQSLSPWHRYILRMEDRMFRDAKLRAVICNSEMVRQDIAHRYPQLASKLHVIHNGVDHVHFHPGLRELHREKVREQLGVPESTRVLLFVGSGFERKGVPQLIEALAQPALAQAELWVIGKDRHARRLQKRAERLGVASRVRFLGPKKDVAPYLGAADVFALPTLYDPMPNAAIEALASGLPVLTSTSSGAAELVRLGENGERVDALDIPGMAAAAHRLLEAMHDPLRCSTFRNASRASVDTLSNEAMAAQLVALYRQLLGGASQL